MSQGNGGDSGGVGLSPSPGPRWGGGWEPRRPGRQAGLGGSAREHAQQARSRRAAQLWRHLAAASPQAARRERPEPGSGRSPPPRRALRLCKARWPVAKRKYLYIYMSRGENLEDVEDVPG